MVSNCGQKSMFFKTRAFCEFAHIFRSIFCIVDVFPPMFLRQCFSSIFLHRCFSSMFFHRCFFIDVFSSMFFINGLLLEIDIFYHRCFTIDVLHLIIDFMSMFRVSQTAPSRAEYKTSITYLVTRPHPVLAHVHARGLVLSSDN